MTRRRKAPDDVYLHSVQSGLGEADKSRFSVIRRGSSYIVMVTFNVEDDGSLAYMGGWADALTRAEIDALFSKIARVFGYEAKCPRTKRRIDVSRSGSRAGGGRVLPRDACPGRIWIRIADNVIVLRTGAAGELLRGLAEPLGWELSE